MENGTCIQNLCSISCSVGIHLHMERSIIFRKLTISMAMVNSYIKLPEIDPGNPTWVTTTVVTTPRVGFKSCKHKNSGR